MYLSDRDLYWAIERNEKHNFQYICFIDGKSTRARTGILVHLTAPTIHAGWKGNVVLEIVNLGPFTFVLQEDDVIAQLTVATISSSPQQTHAEAGSSMIDQVHVSTKKPPDRRPRTRNRWSALCGVGR